MSTSSLSAQSVSEKEKNEQGLIQNITALPNKEKRACSTKKRALKRCNSPVKRRVHSQIKF